MLKNTKTNESGRSMVEMLGVLAVIGVLSVAGIAGYTNTMNKHRANELLNEASKRAVICVAQISAGRIPSVGEFTNPTGHTFEVKGPDGTSAWANTDKQFSITITGVSEAVCNQMKNTAGATIKEFSPDTCASGNENNVKLTFNNDMSTGDVASGGGETPPTPIDPCANVTCEAGKTCWRGQCLTSGGACANSECSSNSDCCSDAPFCAIDVINWDGNKCSASAHNLPCSTSSDCDESNPFCAEYTEEFKVCVSSPAENECPANGCNLIGYGGVQSSTPYCTYQPFFKGWDNYRYEYECTSTNDYGECTTSDDCTTNTPYCAEFDPSVGLGHLCYDTPVLCSSDNDCNGVVGFGGVVSSGLHCCGNGECATECYD